MTTCELCRSEWLGPPFLWSAKNCPPYLQDFFVLDDWLPNGFKLKMAVLRQIEALGYLKSEIFVTRDPLWDNLPATSHEVSTGVLKFLVTVEDKLECDS